MEQCDGCRRVFSLRNVELVGKQILCADCAPAEFTAPLHPHLPTHPQLRGARPAARP
jgi:recombinational DNA repair protein (RecF pathway)